MITYDNNLSAADYANLRKMIGWSEITETQAQRGIDHTTFLITAKEDGKTIAMARVLFDYGYTAYISDVIVLPQYQGHGIGRYMLEEIFSFLESHSVPGEYVSYFLQAAAGKEGFYEKFGFVRRPQGEMGAGMTKRISEKLKIDNKNS